MCSIKIVFKMLGVCVFSYRLKHSQPDFTKLVLQGVGLLYNNCTPLPGFLRDIWWVYMVEIVS